LQIVSDNGDGQELFELLTETDEGKLSELAEAKKAVPKFCATHWTATVSILSALLAKYVEVLRTVEEIRDYSTGESKNDASSYIRLPEDSQFVVALTLSQPYLIIPVQVKMP